MLATQEEFLPPILIRSFYDFAHRISFRDNTLYRCNVKLANCVIFFFFLENLPETNISLVWRFVFGQLSKGRYISITKNKRSYRLTSQSFNFRITKYYSEVYLIAHHRSDNSLRFACHCWLQWPK